MIGIVSIEERDGRVIRSVVLAVARLIEGVRSGGLKDALDALAKKGDTHAGRARQDVRLDGGIDLDATDAFVGALHAVPGEQRHCSTCACGPARPAVRRMK